MLVVRDTPDDCIVKLNTNGLWQMMYMDSADDGPDDWADDIHGGPDDGWPMMDCR